MSRRARTGLDKNNKKFSNCSMEKMGPFIISVKNQLLENNEECHCGFI